MTIKTCRQLVCIWISQIRRYTSKKTPLKYCYLGITRATVKKFEKDEYKS